MCAGTKIGGQRAAEKNLANDPDFYKKIGKIGGKNGNIGGFKSDKVGKDGLTGYERAVVVRSKGGTVSRRRPKIVEELSSEKPKTNIFTRLFRK